MEELAASGDAAVLASNGDAAVQAVDVHAARAWAGGASLHCGLLGVVAAGVPLL